MSLHSGRLVVPFTAWGVEGELAATTAAQECYNWHRNKTPSPAAWGRKSAAIRRELAREEIR